MSPRDQPAEPAAVLERSRVGLCVDCRHARRVSSAKGSSFWLCGRAVGEPERFAKYPRLPVLRCDGFDLRVSD